MARTLLLFAVGVAVVMLVGSPAISRAALVIDPHTVTGVNAIDPLGAQQVDFVASGATPQSLLEARSDFRVIQYFTGFLGAPGHTQNIVSFSDPLLPDIRFTVSSSGSLNTGAGAHFDNASGTSDRSSIALLSGGSADTTYYDIEFGHYDATTSIFSTGVAGVDASAFTISNLWYDVRQNVTAEYFDRAKGLLATQTATAISSDPHEGGSRADAYFGYDVFGTATPSTDIGSIRITVNPGPGRGNSGVTFDDFGFTSATPTIAAVPEPASGLVMLGTFATFAVGSFLRRGRCNESRRAE